MMNELLKVRSKKKKPNNPLHTPVFTSVLAKGPSYYCMKCLFAKRSFVFQACLPYLLLSWSFVMIIFIMQLLYLQ